MRTLPPAVLTALAGNDIWPVKLLDIQIGDTTYYVSDHYKNIVFNGNTYLANGDLLSISDVVVGTRANNDSVDISLSAIDGALRLDVLDADATGGEVTFYRGLIDPDTGGLIGAPITSYRGFIFSVAITDDFPDTVSNSALSESTFSVTVDVRSKVFRLGDSPGVFTNNESQQQIRPGDLSMQYVESLNGRSVTFGGEG